MPIHETDTFAGAEGNGSDLKLRWVSSARPQGVLEPIRMFIEDVRKFHDAEKEWPKSYRDAMAVPAVAAAVEQALLPD